MHQPSTASGSGQAARDVDAQLVKALGFWSTTLFVVGSVIGSGIFLTTGLMAAQIPSAPLLLLAWTLGGVMALAGGLTYAEMGTMFPRSGGVYVFLSEAYSPLVGFLYGWGVLLVVVSGGIAAVAVGFADYLSYFAPGLGTSRVLFVLPAPWGEFTLTAGQLTAAASIVTLGAVNYIGVRSGNLVNLTLTLAKVGGLAALPLVALVVQRATPEFTPVIPPGIDRPLAAFGVAMIAVLWTYEAWYFVTYAAGEIKDPRRTLPRAMTAGILILTTVYLTVNIAYLYAVPVEQMKGVSRIGELAATALVGPGGATFVSLTVVLSTFGCNAAAILAGSRLLFAMAQDGVFFHQAAAVHPRYRTPHVAIVALTAWSTILALSGTYEQLFTYVIFSSILFSAAGGLAVFVLRRTRPLHPRPYRTWGYPITPALFVLGSVAFVVNTLVERPVESMAGLGIVGLGLPAYWYWKRRGARNEE
jgi:APA family basic amino acid/polyamine antiporter